MRKFLNILLSLPVAFSACSEYTSGIPIEEPSLTTQIRLGPGFFATRIVDEDNLTGEQVINNVSVFFTDPGTDNIVLKHIFPGFTTSGDYRIVTIPLEPAQLGRKDIYVVTNYDNSATLDTVTTVSGLEQLRTPIVSKSENLEPGNGFCMYGMLAGFNFTDSSLGSPIVNVARTCAKIRVTLSFPGNPRLSPVNTFLITHAASYTYIGKDSGDPIPSGAYFNFANETAFEPYGTAFRNTAYVYEADQAPILYVYTHINESTESQEFIATLPIPERNYLYDIDVRVYEDLPGTRSTDIANSYRLQTTVTAYDEGGNEITVFF